MAHLSHPRELGPPVLAEAVRRISGTGAVIRTQAPLIRSINDDPDVWRTTWRTQVRMGMVPFYMIQARDPQLVGMPLYLDYGRRYVTAGRMTSRKDHELA